MQRINANNRKDLQRAVRRDYRVSLSEREINCCLKIVLVKSMIN